MSLQTLICQVTARCLHLLSHWFEIHYRPVEIPFALYFGFDVVSAVSGIGCITMFMKVKSTYESEKDNFGITIFDCLVPKTGILSSRPIRASIFIYIVAVILAFFWSFFRQSPGTWGTGYFCCVYEVMCAVALIPQLWMFHKEKTVSPLLGWFVVFVALNRCCTLSFWVTFTWVNPWNTPANRFTQIVTELANLLLLGDFLFYWARAKIRGESIVVGTSSGDV